MNKTYQFWVEFDDGVIGSYAVLRSMFVSLKNYGAEEITMDKKFKEDEIIKNLSEDYELKVIFKTLDEIDVVHEILSMDDIYDLIKNKVESEVQEYQYEIKTTPKDNYKNGLKKMMRVKY